MSQLPTFILGGAQKAGTTALFTFLSEHPDVYGSDPKEPWFFSQDKEFERGLEWYASTYFSGWSGQRAVGEGSTTYLRSRQVAERVAEALPETRWIFVLRNPTERAFSHYLYDVRRGIRLASESFSELIRGRGDVKGILRSGFYASQVTCYHRLFGPERVRVFLYEDFHARPADVVRACYAHIGVDPAFAPDIERQYNVTRYASPAYKRLQRAWKPIRALMSPKTVARTKRLRSAVLERFFRSGRVHRPALSGADRAYLNALYRDSNAQLAELLGRDLSSWNA